MDGGIPILKFENIAFGSAGAGTKSIRGDHITPLGAFVITSISAASRFRHFIQINYPDLETAQDAFADRRISKTVYRQIVAAHKNHRLPPQNTILGGNLGIHGIGKADPAIHRLLDWTNGCVALENWQIEQLLRYDLKGSFVLIEDN